MIRELDWFKSSYSDSSNPEDCVEVATTPGTIHVRDSKNTSEPHVTFARPAWAEFITYASES
ncbi:DUF397 domain-containing protein [Streptomyces spectabilis]|uniref:DUF397 domain-containing protein n=1 Tax=Streptomyces spectabilis TaxID=68270 RepID=A0A5P2X8F1_STRST|nr:DUF397 domain-containing protein [Streptomyces spectabilis]MBB5102963.1 hypothetical protein [Streptomyces spectabilis]MCI3902163.1 DUF397 domain-containing protein [Streptomyces spectabilis]QEV59549.1 DUF397 domain-containing protein [Streptomyces spectabilis]GGV15613.1 DUF397 domain-containing protein [Streptomyces spectabilis]